MASPEHSDALFGSRVQDCFGRSAGRYEQGAQLQAAIAARLGRHCRRLAAQIPAGPRADLGAGSGLLGRAVEANLNGPPLLRVDQCSALLAQEPGSAAGQRPPQLAWDLNAGLPPALGGAALLASSFALQWLEHPEQQLAAWCQQLAPGGWLVLAVPTAGSFGIWRAAAAAAAVPYSGLPLPPAAPLEAIAQAQLQLQRLQRLRFNRPNRGARDLLHQIKSIGAQASRQRRLSTGELRRLIDHWPGPDHAVNWEVLLLLGQKR
ncbi:MAG: SAM-dependent methyltransferase [Synechococcaceae bacterium WB4_1_0192]|jgi:malonyl-CoA O-methyltransferase|nr:SAM-dependent methyltransferase [Synechococcaceae bacterium WB4_1_0192]